MTTVLALACVALLAYVNGANDNFKGVATLFGSGVSDYKKALNWATAMTFAGSLSAVWLTASWSPPSAANRSSRRRRWRCPDSPWQ